MTTPANAPGVAPAAEAPNEFHKEVENFSAHCAYIRSVYILAMRIWRDPGDKERRIMDDVAPSFFADIGQVLAEYVVLAACRITDPADDGRYENLTLETFVDSFAGGSQTAKQLDDLRRQMNTLREKIEPARNKLVAHADRDAIRQGKPLGQASWKEWEDFWSALTKFVRLLNEKVLGSPYEIDIAGVHGDAEVFIKTFKQSQYFLTLLNDQDPTVKTACLNVALRDT